MADSSIDLHTLRHSASHILAEAVLKLYPGTKLGIGPATEEGFYYDFDLPQAITDKDLPKIEKTMKKIIQKNEPFEKVDSDIQQAKKILSEQDQDYKMELVSQLEDPVTFYKSGDFMDLCKGPHIEKTGQLKAFKLTSVAGAYWRGSEDNKMLTRIYGTAFLTREELDEHLNLIEEAKKRDHRKLGKELDLFSLHEEAPANPFFHDKGTKIYNKLVDFARSENTKRGYEEIMTPLILSEDLWHKSGHYDNYKENMYFTKVDDRDFAVKPMNCPGGLLVYKTRKYSYKDLPLKMAEFGRVHRHEKSGVTHGLFRVRTFTQDDAHVFCTEEQIEQEIIKIIDYVFHTYRTFGFEDFAIELSTRPEKAIGSDQVWEKAEEALKKALEHAKIEYQLNEGDGAFYGPKIDFHIKDSLKRSWQCGTIQLDFSMPERFELTYTGSDGQDHRPVMIHRAIFGSIERFLGILLEHYAGKLPFWLSPEQIRIIPVADAHNDYAHQLADRFKESNLLVKVDDSNEKLGYKIRQGQLAKIPYMMIVGDKEIESQKISVRSRDEGELGASTVEEFLARV